MTTSLGLLLLQIGATLHGVQLPATAALGRVLRRSGFLLALPDLARAALGVLAGGVVLAVAAGALSLWLLPENALTQPFARVQILGWAVFWGYRLLAQLLVYRRFVPLAYRPLHWLLALLFLVKSCCFGFAAWLSWS